MLEKDIEAGLNVVGTGETKQQVQRWLYLALTLAGGEAVTVTVLSLALAKLGKDWPGEVLIAIGAVYHVLAVGLAIVLFRRVKRELGRDHDPALPLWLLKAFGPFLFGPYLMLPFVAFAKQLAHPELWIACVLILGSASWFGALVLYLAALWVRAWFTCSLEIVTLTPIDAEELPPASRAYLDAAEEEFEVLGFEKLGDYRQKEGERQYARYFVGADGKFVGEAVCCETQNMKTCSMVSLLADGTYIESAGLEVGEVPHAPEKLVMRGGAGKTVAELLESHGATVQAECAARDTEPLRIPVDQLELVAHYGLWMSHESLVAQRFITENPYAPLLESIRQGIRELLPEPVEV